MIIKDKALGKYFIKFDGVQYSVGFKKRKDNFYQAHFTTLAGAVLYIAGLLVAEKSQEVDLRGYVKIINEVTDNVRKAVDEKIAQNRNEDRIQIS